jgi:OmpA-OmpF porin, OOP family
MKFTKSQLAKYTGTLGITLAAVLTAPLLLAEDAGWYAGFNVGESQGDFQHSEIVNGLLQHSTIGSVYSFEDDSKDIGYKVYGGYQFNRYIAVESGYFDLGQFDFAATTLPSGALDGQIKIRGLNFDLVGTLPITEKLSAFVRGGATYSQVRDTFRDAGAVNIPDKNRENKDTDYKFGGGMEYAITDNLGMRLEAERYRVNDAVGNNADVDLYSLGLLYRFGQAAAPVAVAAAPAAAEPMRQAPPPAAPPAPQRVSFSADSLFDFDKAAIKPAGRQELDTFVAELRSTNYDSIAVTGHTDRIGSHDYNMRLSQQRAEAVKDYIVGSGVPSGKVSATGVNGSNPVTKPADCTMTARPALIVCLQPDRRVEVEVNGTQK